MHCFVLEGCFAYLPAAQQASIVAGGVQLLFQTTVPIPCFGLSSPALSSNGQANVGHRFVLEGCFVCLPAVRQDSIVVGSVQLPAQTTVPIHCLWLSSPALNSSCLTNVVHCFVLEGCFACLPAVWQIPTIVGNAQLPVQITVPIPCLWLSSPAQNSNGQAKIGHRFVLEGCSAYLPAVRQDSIAVGGVQLPAQLTVPTPCL